SVKCDYVLATDPFDRFDRALAGAGVLGPIQLLEKFPADDRPGAVLTAPDALDRLELGQLDPAGLKGRLSQERRKDFDPAVEVFLEHVERRGTGLASHRHVDIDRKLFQVLV